MNKGQEIEKLKNSNVYISSDKSSYLSLNSDLTVSKPYHGIYIVEKKIHLLNVSEKIMTDKYEYDVKSSKYLDTVNLEENSFGYKCEDIEYVKKIGFIENSDVFCIEYTVKNNTDTGCKFKVIPYLTYKDINCITKAKITKFNKREIDSGLLINLSITDNANIVIKSPVGRLNIIDEYIDYKLKDKTTIDAYIPNEFEVDIVANKDLKFRMYFSHKDFEIKTYSKKSFLKNNIEGIKEEYIELKKLAKAVSLFELDFLTNSFPVTFILKDFDNESKDNTILVLIDVVKAIPGQYLVGNDIKKAKERLLIVLEYINKLNDDTDTLEFLKLKLWTIETINKIYERDTSIYKISKKFLETTIAYINSLIQNEDIKYLKYIEIITLVFNAFKIYEKVSDTISCFGICESLSDVIQEKFWDNNMKVLRYSLEDKEPYATPEMIYALSLSYQSIDKDISIKLLDTAFKELYTPYGLRCISKSSTGNKGLIYPKYMAHFVKANLKQNGVTYVSQKLSYNLVKELLLEIDKTNYNTVKSVYHEKGVNMDKDSIDLLTTAEMIRLYDMLT